MRTPGPGFSFSILTAVLFSALSVPAPAASKVDLSEFGFKLRVEAIPSNLTRLRQLPDGSWAKDDLCDGNARGAWVRIPEKGRPVLSVYDGKETRAFQILSAVRGPREGGPERVQLGLEGSAAESKQVREKSKARTRKKPKARKSAGASAEWLWLDKATGEGTLTVNGTAHRYVSDKKAGKFPSATELTGECRPRPTTSQAPEGPK